MDLEQILKKLGLSEKSAKVYLAVLEFGPQTASQISQKTNLRRPTTYVQIDYLTKNGLMSKVEKGGRIYFAAASPENLERLIENKKKDIETTSSEFRKNLAQLKQLFDSAEEKPRIRFFEGKKGLLSIVNDFKKSKFDSAEEFVPLDAAFETIPADGQDYRRHLAKKFKKIPFKVIYTSAKGVILPSKQGLHENRFVPKNLFPDSGSITIYGNKVAFFAQKKEMIGVIIESREIAQTIKALFNLAWEAAKSSKK